MQRVLAITGVLFLRGRLFSVHEKQVAQEVVAGVGGVTKVVNEIQVGDRNAAQAKTTTRWLGESWMP